MTLYKPDLLMLFYNKSLLQTDIKGLIVFYKIQLTMISPKVENNIFRLRPTTFFTSKLSLAFFHHQANIFLSLRMYPMRKYFSCMKRFFHQRRFPLSKNFSFIKDVFHKLTFFLQQGNFPQANIFSWSRKFCTGKHFTFIRNIFIRKIFFLYQGSFPWSKTFSTSKDFSLIKEISCSQKIFLIAKISLWTKALYTFPTKSYAKTFLIL